MRLGTSCATEDATCRDNYFADTVWLGIYFGVRGALTGIDTRYVFRDNVLTGLEAPIDVGYFDAPFYDFRMLDPHVFRLACPSTTCA